MNYFLLYLHLVGICIFWAHSNAKIDTRKIPENLLMGVASSSYQVEGAWNEDGKGENIWDRFVHTRPDKIRDGSTGDIACDSYHKIKEDVTILKELGVDYYRFSLSWSRILPTGFANEINPAGIAYYNNLINALIDNDIVPIVSMFHWDLPQPLQDLGGFANPDIAIWLRDYARVVFENFGDRVKTWITINEPKQICQFGYEAGTFAPGVNSSGIGVYICARNVLMGHAHMYHLYDSVYKPRQQGRISIVVECSWSEPASDSKADVSAADRRRQFDFGLYTHPIYHKDGDYPTEVKHAIAERSKLERFPASRLPKLSWHEVHYIRGTYDFFGLNHYTTFYVKDSPSEPLGVPSQDKDTRVDAFQDTKWLTGAFYYFRLVPWGLRKALNYIKNNYGNPPILITENGFPDAQIKEDDDRIRFYNESIQAVLDSIYNDGVRVEGYTAWSLMDNYEWNSGYTLRFGFYYIDFVDPNRTRTPKKSAGFYKQILQRRSL